MEGFTEVPYEGVDIPLLVCDRGDFDTWLPEMAEAHLAEHARKDADAAFLAELQQATEPDYGPDPPEPPKPRARKKKEEPSAEG